MSWQKNQGVQGLSGLGYQSLSRALRACAKGFSGKLVTGVLVAIWLIYECENDGRIKEGIEQ